MLKVRIIPTLLYKDLGLVKGERFCPERRVGTARQTFQVYALRQVDEMCLLDITATQQEREPDYIEVDDLADDCFMPLSVGGGVNSVDRVRQLLRVGADKVVINTALVTNPEIVAESARKFGAQCIVASIDYRIHEDGSREVFTHSGTRATGLDPVELAHKMEGEGAGEILFTCIDYDGMMTGYDIPGLASVAESVSIPVIASGGAGSYEDMYQAWKEGGASALAAASIYHFTQQTPLEAKMYLKERNVPVRL